MLAHAEARGDLRGIHRRAQEGAHDALAIGIVEAVGAALRPVAHHDHGALEQAQLARQQAAGMGDAAVAGHELLEQHRELHALLELALEVDVVGHRADELDHRLRWHAELHAALLQRAVTLGLDAHDARAHLVDLLFAVIRAVVAARDDVLALGLRPHRERQHARRVGLLGHVLQQQLDLLADRQPLLLEERRELLVDLLAIGFRHVDVGQHLVDRVALLQAQRELVAVGRRRLGLAVGLAAASSRSRGDRPTNS